MKLSTVVNAIPVISKLMSKELPVIQSYEVAKLARRIDEETKLYNEQRQKLLQQIIKQSTALIFRLQTAEKMQAISSLQKMIKTDSVKKAISWRWTIK